MDRHLEMAPDFLRQFLVAAPPSEEKKLHTSSFL